MKWKMFDDEIPPLNRPILLRTKDECFICSVLWPNANDGRFKKHYYVYVKAGTEYEWTLEDGMSWLDYDRNEDDEDEYF